MFGISSSRQHSSSSSLDISESRSNSESLSRGSSQSFGTQRLAFEDILRSLYGGAADAATAQVAKAPLFEEEAQQLFTGGLDFLDRLQALPGSDYLESRVNGPDLAAETQINTLGSNLGQFFQEQLLPGITSRGVSTGTLGGSRQAVAQGRAAGEVSRSYSAGVTQILANSQAARDTAALGLNASTINAASTGLDALPSVLGLAGAGFNAGLSPYLGLSQIIGSPTVLSESGSSSEDIATAISNAIASSYGTSQSSSKGKSAGLSFGPFSGAS